MKNYSKVGLLLLTGIAVGAVAGLLLAPDKGTETRKQLAKKAKKLKKDLKKTADEYKDKASDLKDKVSDIKDKVVNTATKIKESFN